MPLSRLSIKSAVKLARDGITIRPVRGSTRMRVLRLYDRGGVVETEPMVAPAARIRLREARIFAALVALGVEHDDARAAAEKGHDDDRDWPLVVAEHMERLALCRPRINPADHEDPIRSTTDKDV